MSKQPNYSSRNFSRATKAEAFECSKDSDGVPRCANCTTHLVTGHIEYDHEVSWEICRYSGPSNCQVLCTSCHLLKTGEEDIPAIAANNARRASHIGARTKPRHPFPCGRDSRWSKPVGAFAPVGRLSQHEKLALVLERRAIIIQQAEA